jgi:phosphatidylglycerophosphate synthase
MEDPLNRYFYHPLAARLARLLEPTGISPNAVSVMGMVSVWAAAWCYAALAWPLGALLGFVLLLLWHVLDGADGDLARMTGKSSPTGELVDGVCDYSAQTLMYFVLAAILDDWIGGWAWPMAVLAGISHVAQTNHAETQRRSYLWWAYGVPWLKHAQASGDKVFRTRNWFGRWFAWLARGYLALGVAMAPWSARLDAAVDAAAGDPRRLARIRRLVRRSSRTSLRLEKAVGPNPRTILLGGAMLAGSPLWFFLGEIVLLNAILVLSVIHHNRVGRALVTHLS